MMTIRSISRIATMWAIVFSLLFISACGDFDDEDLAPESALAFGIRHDKSLSDYESVAANQSPYSTDDYPDFSSVVNFVYSLDNNGDEFVATGVLVAPRWILTAGHNFFVSDEQTQPASVNLIDVNVGVDPNSPSATLAVEELVFHPTWLNESEVIIGANDLCLVKLATPITDITPAILNSSESEPVGNISWFGGYGDYSTRPGQNEDLFSNRHAIGNILDRAVDGIQTRTASNVVYEGGLVAFDFDSPDGLVNSLGDDFTSEDEPLLGGGSSSAMALEFEGTTVEGDSGGPLFLRMGNEWRVIGILSGGANEPVLGHRDSSYGDISVFTRVSTSYNWIASVIE